MISTDLLARLQKADNVTLERVCQTAVGEYESFDGDGFEVKYTVSYEELFDDAYTGSSNSKRSIEFLWKIRRNRRRNQRRV